MTLCALEKADLHICKGAAFSQVFRWASEVTVYKPITAITRAAPPVITASTHGLVDQWPVAIASVKGMVGINASRTPPGSNDYHPATVLTGDTISLNDVNALDFGAYASGGTLIYQEPESLASADIYMAFLTKKGGTEITGTRLTETAGVTVDDALKTITASMVAATTDALTFTKAYYILFDDTTETALFEGDVTVDDLIST